MPAGEEYFELTVRVTPRSAKTEVIGNADGVLQVRIAAPPVDNAANEVLIKLLAKHFGVAKTSVDIVGGAASRNKRVRIRRSQPR